MTMTNYDGTLTLYVGTCDGTWERPRIYAYEDHGGGSWKIVIIPLGAIDYQTPQRVDASTPAEVVRECQNIFAHRNLKLGKIAREYLEGKR